MVKPDRILLRSSPSEDTSPEMGLLLGHALAMDYKRVVIARDLMKSSTMMKEALVAGLTSSGADVIDLGCTSAPVTAMMAKHGDCAVYITEYREYGLISGYLLMNSNGSLFRKDQIRHLDKIFTEKQELPDYRHLGNVRTYNFATEEYNRRLLSILRAPAGCSLVLDCNCGVSADSAPQVLNGMGADVIAVNAQKDRNFISRPMSMTEAEHREIRQFVESDPGTIGVILNRIGTLATILDEKGSVMDSEKVLALIVMFLKPKCIVVPANMTSLVDDHTFRGCSRRGTQIHKGAHGRGLGMRSRRQQRSGHRVLRGWDHIRRHQHDVRRHLRIGRCGADVGGEQSVPDV